MALVETLVDNFNDNSINTGLWNSFGTNLAESSQTLRYTSLTSSEYGGVNSDVTYDLTSSYAYIQMADAGNQAIAKWEVYPLYLSLDASNALYILIENGTIHFAKRVAGVNTNLVNATYSSTTHAWLRIRESGGTCYWDSSTDGVNWTNRASNANPFAVTALTVEIQAGTWGGEVSTTTAIWDNFNTTGATATSSKLTLLGVG